MKSPLPPRVLMCVLSFALSAILWTLAGRGSLAAQAGPLDTGAIDRAIGKPGQLTGDVYRVTFPRSDLQVTVKGVSIRSGLALTGWAAFKAIGSEAAADGDLALTEAEVTPVLAKLRAGQMDITAVHNHLLGESPRVVYVHFWGRGPAAGLASSLHAALALTAIPLTTPAPAPGAGDVAWADQIQKTLGLKGAVNGGVLALSKPRSEPIAMMGVTLPPSMGMATGINVQAAEAGKVASTGDFVLTGDEVNPVISALTTHGIDVTALHNHMIHPNPELYFMHFWAHDTPDRVAAGLKAALDAMAKATSPAMQR